MNIQSLVVFIVISLTMSANLKTNEDQIFGVFQNFMRNFDKSYSTLDEHNTRYAIFRDNYANIQSSRTTWVQGINKFTDMDPNEFRMQYLTFRPDSSYIQNPSLQSSLESSQTSRDSNEPVLTSTASSTPATLDYRTTVAVGPVKDQGTCGCCWAFSAIANIEGRYALKYGSYISFSEEQLLDCDISGNSGCNGGSSGAAFTYLQSSSGLAKTTSYPYTGVQKACASTSTNSAVKITGYTSVGGTEASIQQALIANGPLAGAIDGTNLASYSSGIYNCATPVTSINGLSHAVTIVGYGSSSAGSYWIIRNSWGSKWGQGGYFYLAKGVNACGINLYALTANIA